MFRNGTPFPLPGRRGQLRAALARVRQTQAVVAAAYCLRQALRDGGRKGVQAALRGLAFEVDRLEELRAEG
jgi:hypothetical protein